MFRFIPFNYSIFIALVRARCFLYTKSPSVVYLLYSNRKKVQLRGMAGSSFILICIITIESRLYDGLRFDIDKQSVCVTGYCSVPTAAYWWREHVAPWMRVSVQVRRLRYWPSLESPGESARWCFESEGVGIVINYGAGEDPEDAGSAWEHAAGSHDTGGSSMREEKGRVKR